MSDSDREGRGCWGTGSDTRTFIHRNLDPVDRLDERLKFLESAPDRGHIDSAILEVVRSGTPVQAKLHREDLLGGLAAGLVIVLATLPVVAPFLVVPDPDVAVRVSNGVALALLFLLGTSWARAVGGRPLTVGLALTGIGVVLVTITIALGG